MFQLLKSVYLFQNFSDTELHILEKIAESETFQMGDDIFESGDTAVSFYVIKHGSVKILSKTPNGADVEVATLGTGSHFGDMAFVDRDKRAATARTIERTTLIKFDFNKLDGLLEANPVLATKFYKSCSHFLAARLRITTSDLSFAREKNMKHF